MAATRKTIPALCIVPPLTDSEKLLFRVFDNARPIGYARLKKHSRRQLPCTDASTPDNYELRMIEVAQNYRHLGVGTTLLQAVIGFCREHNVQLLTGEIKGDAPALRQWYRQNGFSVKADDSIALLPTVSL